MLKAVSFNYTEDKVEETIDDIVNDETGESNPNFVYSDEDDYVGLELPNIEKKEIVKEDIFDEPEVKEVKPLKLELKDDIEMDIVEEEVIPLTKMGRPMSLNKNGQPRKTRKPMSEEQKRVCAENLRRGREKKKLNSEENGDKLKINRDRMLRRKELIEKKKELELQKLENAVNGLEEVVEHTKPKPRRKKEEEPPTPRQSTTSNLSSDSIKQIQLDAILEYDALRKERKKIKKQNQLVENEKQKLRDSLTKEMSAIPKWKQAAGKWANYY